MASDVNGAQAAPAPGASSLFSAGFLALNLQFALVTAIAASFFAFSGYLQFLGIGPATAGFIISADALAALIVQPLITPLVHAGTARRWLCGGSLLLALALFMAGRVTTVPFLVAARLLQGSGFICVVAALITMIVQFIPPEMSGRAFGWISLVRLVPYAVIPPLYDLLRVTPGSFGTVLNVAVVAALAPVLVLALPRPEQAENRESARPPGITGMRDSLRCRPVLMLLLSTLLFFSGYSGIFFYLKQFGTGRGIVNVSLFFSIATVVMIAVRLLGGWMFDRYSKVLLCGTALLLTAASYALLPAFAGGGLFFPLAAATGLGWGIAMPLQAAVMFDISEPGARAMNQNLLIVMMQGGFFIGPFLGGRLISCSGYETLFFSLAAVTLAAMIMMAGVGRFSREQIQQTQNQSPGK
ncbi:MAG TPA: MFS transporter [Geobacteraceae bacterium]